MERVRHKYHVLEHRDKLPDLAARYGVSVRDIINWNHISDPKKLYPGQRIIVQKGVRKRDKRRELTAEEKDALEASTPQEEDSADSEGDEERDTAGKAANPLEAPGIVVPEGKEEEVVEFDD